MRHSESIAKLAPALVKAVNAMEGVTKNSENEGFKRNGVASRYATLAACVEASRDALSDNGLCVIQGPGASNTEAKTLCITTRILHESGEWIETDFDMPLTKWSPHEAGSATTYGRRFALMAMLGLAPVEDDDGNAASGMKPTGAVTAAKVAIDLCKTPADLEEWSVKNKQALEQFDAPEKQQIRDYYAKRLKEVKE